MHRRLGYTLLVTALCCASCTGSPGPASASPQGEEGSGENLAQAEVIFVGKVERQGVAEGSPAADPEKSVVVLIEQMVKPGEGSPLRGFEGREVSVVLREPGSPPVGSRVTFFTRFAALGTGLTLVELGHRMVEEEASGLAAPLVDARAEAEKMIREQQDKELAARLDGAAVVVVGRVSQIRGDEVEGLIAGGAQEREPVTEHAPQWREAVIEVTEALKGGQPGEMNTIVVRFASSRDVMWADSPKFEVGQEGVFVLDQEDMMDLTSAALATFQAGGQITDPGSFLAAEELERVKRLIDR